MANLELVTISPMKPNLVNGHVVDWVEDNNKKKIEKLPQVFLKDGSPWDAVNSYALSRSNSVSPKTVSSNLSHLKAFADWLEDIELDWRHFPEKKMDRCLFKYRGYLIAQRNAGLLYPSTTSARMSATIGFYRWAQIYGWIDRKCLWQDNLKVLPFYDSVGFARTMLVLSSELSIPNRRTSNGALEDGLFPISDDNQMLLLKYLKDNNMTELYLMCMLGCYSGARSDTIRSLTVSCLENAIDDPTVPDFKRIRVGPGTRIRTKSDVSGSLLIPSLLVEELLAYAYSVRRLMRFAVASKVDRDLLFLTQRGNAYKDTSFTKLISNLRSKLVEEGLSQFFKFKFHQTRATFGTKLMRLALEKLPNKIDAIKFVRDAMLHKHESTTWKYIKFIEIEPTKQALSDEFFNLYTGLLSKADELIAEVIYDGKTT